MLTYKLQRYFSFIRKYVISDKYFKAVNFSLISSSDVVRAAALCV